MRDIGVAQLITRARYGVDYFLSVLDGVIGHKDILVQRPLSHHHPFGLVVATSTTTPCTKGGEREHKDQERARRTKPRRAFS